jgi:ribosomal protein S18 acetylase RimI-like enzyme
MTMQTPPDVLVREMRASDAPAIEALADRVVGPGYYPQATVLEYLDRATKDGVVCAHVAFLGERLVGFRFALPPGRWSSGRGRGLSPDRWPVPLEQAAYFQSAYVDFDAMGHGIGRRMATMALDALRRLGALAVVTHSWKEAPHGSSFRYLSRLGFQPVAEYPEYWSEVDYTCWLDGKPCRCTAVEMVLDLREVSP